MKKLILAAALVPLVGCDLIGDVVPILQNPLKVYCTWDTQTMTMNFGEEPGSKTEKMDEEDGFDFTVDHTASTMSWEDMEGDVLALKYRPAGFVGTYRKAEDGEETRLTTTLGWDYSLTMLSEFKKQEKLATLLMVAQCEPYVL